MGSTQSAPAAQEGPKGPYYFLIDRTFAAPEAHGRIAVGVIGTASPQKQGIRIGNDRIHLLEDCVKGVDTLYYSFDSGVRLFVSKSQDKSVEYELTTPTLQIKEKIPDVVLRMYKPIDMSDCSKELDELKGVFSGSA
jgi:hypothetical protein